MWPPALRAEVVCGCANNQLAARQASTIALARAGVLYCPDFVVNAGGVIQVADERHGFDFERAKAKASGIHDTLLEVVAAGRHRRHHAEHRRRPAGRATHGRRGPRRAHLDRTLRRAPRPRNRSATARRLLAA